MEDCCKCTICSQSCVIIKKKSNLADLNVWFGVIQRESMPTYIGVFSQKGPNLSATKHKTEQSLRESKLVRSSSCVYPQYILWQKKER